MHTLLGRPHAAYLQLLTKELTFFRRADSILIVEKSEIFSRTPILWNVDLDGHCSIASILCCINYSFFKKTRNSGDPNLEDASFISQLLSIAVFLVTSGQNPIGKRSNDYLVTREYVDCQWFCAFLFSAEFLTKHKSMITCYCSSFGSAELLTPCVLFNSLLVELSMPFGCFGMQQHEFKSNLFRSFHQRSCSVMSLWVLRDFVMSTQSPCFPRFFKSLSVKNLIWLVFGIRWFVSDRCTVYYGR